MTIEVEVPAEWSPGQALAARALLQQVLRSGFPVITCVRPDATPEQVEEIYQRIRTLISDTGLAA